MKKRHIVAFLLASAAEFGLAPLAHAQPAPSMPPMIELRALNLSQAQEDQVFKIMHEQAPALHEQMKQLRAAHEALARLAAAEPFDAARAKDAADQEGRVYGQLALLHAQGMAKVRAVLTPEQRAKLDERMQGRK